MARKSAVRRKARSKGAPKPANGRATKPRTASSRTGPIDPRLGTYYRGLAVNKPESLQLGAAAIAKMLAADPNDPWANAEEAHRLVNEWRNGKDVPDLRGMFAAAHHHAQLAIKTGMAHADARARPYGHWAEGYVYKYEGLPELSIQHYLRASLYNRNKFLQQPGRRRRALMVEILESYVYWSSLDELDGVVEWIDQEIRDSTSEREDWFLWVKCFALHLKQDFKGSNQVFKDHLSRSDKDISLIAAANHARLLEEAQRRAHRDRFRGKAGNGNWDADKEDARSPFSDQAIRSFWKSSVTLALAPDPKA
jgi:hypothetical protein